MPSRLLTNKKIGRSLILAGGGMRLAYQAGVLQALEEHNLEFDHVDGTSGGIFNAGMLASDLAAADIAERWRKVKIKHFMSLRPLRNYFKPFSMAAYADADGIRNKIFPGLGINVDKIRNHQKAKITFNVCNFSEKTVESVPNTEVEIDHLIAGVSLPIVMPGIEINQQWYSDAVWIKDANLTEAVEHGGQELWLVWAIGNTPEYMPGALNQYVHMIEMSANGGLLEEYARIELINRSIERDDGQYKQKEPVRLFVIKPKFPLPLDPDLYLNKIDARSLINMGYAEAKKQIPNMPEQGVPMDKEATKMSLPGTRLNIRAAYKGLLLKDKRFEKASFYLYLVYSERTEHPELDVYSSFYFQPFGSEISCYDHQVHTSVKKDTLAIRIVGELLCNERKYRLEASLKLYSPVDMMIGMEMKSIQIKLHEEESSELVCEGNLYQNAWERLMSLHTSNVRKANGQGGGIGLKYKLISRLFEYEI